MNMIDFQGLPLRKLKDLESQGWSVNGVQIQRAQEDGTVKHGAVTTGGMVLWWQPEQERVIAPSVRDVMRQTLEVLEKFGRGESSGIPLTVLVHNLRQALAAANPPEFEGFKTVDHWTALTDQDREAVFNSLPDALDGFLKKWGWLHFAKAIEDACRVKNSGASKQWEPEFDAICPKQEALAKQFCEDIAQTHGGLMDPVRLLEMAEALYCAERDESIDPGSSDVVESVARNINAGHDGKYCSDLWPVTADAIRNFVGSDFCSLKFGREDQAPDENDQYLMSAHDLISAFRSWKDFELQLVTQQTPDALHLAAMDLARKQAQRIAELEQQLSALVPCGWQFYQDGKWNNGMEVNNHRQNTEAAGIPIRDVFAHGITKGAA